MPPSESLSPALRTFLLLLGSGLALLGGGGDETELSEKTSAPARVDFQRDVRPILSDTCFTCHGPDAGQRQAGLRLDLRDAAIAVLPSGRRAIVPGDADSSELLMRLAATGDHRMPPAETNKSLAPEQIETLRRWIEAGAEYTPHWSFVPPRRTAVPEVAAKDRVRDPIDAFILRRLEEEGLTPSPEARKERLIRRVTYDLTGLPPTVAEVDAFLADDAPGAYERVVDRLLASPKFGEHRARFWLDAARFGDTHGYHLDNQRSLWPWRDWVIRAFNENLPFDRFTVEQLAGDLLPTPTREQRIATGFNRCNPSTGEGGLIADEYLAIYAADRVETTATTWLGLTVGCARCHDHKYDPISQKEYYELFAFFSSVAEEASDKNAMTPPPMLDVPTAEQMQRLAGMERSIAARERRQLVPRLEADVAQWCFEADLKAALAETWTPLPIRSALSHGGATMELQDDGSVIATGEEPEREVYEVVARHPGGTVATVRLDAIADPFTKGKGAGRASHGNIVLTDVQLELVDRARPASGEALKIATASVGHAQKNYPARFILDGDSGTGWATAPLAHEDQVLVLTLASPRELEPGSLLRCRLHFTSRFARHAIRHLRVSASAREESRGVVFGDWSYLGVMPVAQARQSLHRVLPPEAGPFDAAQEFEGGLRWKERKDLVDDRVHALPKTVGVSYLRRTLDVPDFRTLRFAFGSDDLLKVWIDDEVIHVHDVPRGAKKDQGFAEVSLEPGRHELRMKVVNTGGPGGFFFRVVDEDLLGAPAAVARIALSDPATRTEEEANRVRDWFRRRHDPAWRQLAEEIERLREEMRAEKRRIPRTMVMAESAKPRKTHLLIRGAYDQKGEEVSPGTPAVLPPLPSGRAADRLALARWLVDPAHPLTARVAVNRFWQSVFGAGLVATTEDFGSQGAWPSHPELLDRLAVDFVESGWDVKALLRRFVTSATYRQASRLRPELARRDPDNRLLARGPRFRLDAEMIRDGALQMGGLLVPKIGGPSVKPYQPKGLWSAVGYTSSNTANFEADTGDKLWRRSLYTFWKRTSPPPSMRIFDAPTREACVVRRGRTNTPLQALTLMNDVQFVEAARGLATRLLRAAGTDVERLDRGFRIATARRPDGRERRALKALLDAQRSAFAADPKAAKKLVSVGASSPDPQLDPVALAAWTMVASTLLNLDETVTKG